MFQDWFNILAKVNVGQFQENVFEIWDILQFAKETEVVGENQLWCHFIHDWSHKIWPGVKPRPLWSEADD
jgi:hypothetical protein